MDDDGNYYYISNEGNTKYITYPGGSKNGGGVYSAQAIYAGDNKVYDVQTTDDGAYYFEYEKDKEKYSVNLKMSFDLSPIGHWYSEKGVKDYNDVISPVYVEIDKEGKKMEYVVRYNQNKKSFDKTYLDDGGGSGGDDPDKFYVQYNDKTYEYTPKDVKTDNSGTYIRITYEDEGGVTQSIAVYISIGISPIWYVDKDGNAYPVYSDDNISYYYINNDGDIKNVDYSGGKKGGGAYDAQAIYEGDNAVYDVSVNTDGGYYIEYNDGKETHSIQLKMSFDLSPVGSWTFGKSDKNYNDVLMPVYYDDKSNKTYIIRYNQKDKSYDKTYEEYPTPKSDKNYNAKSGYATVEMKNNATSKTYYDRVRESMYEDDYFGASNLRAWWLKYTLFNDKSAYSWARIPTISMKGVPILYDRNEQKYYVFTGQKKTVGSKTYYYWTEGTTDYFMLYSHADIESQHPSIIDIYDLNYNYCNATKDYMIWKGDLHFYFDGKYNDTSTTTWNNGLGTHFNICNYMDSMEGKSIETVGDGHVIVTSFTYGDVIYDDFGKGVVFRMEDEYANVMPYDFKNIMFARTTMYGGVTALPDSPGTPTVAHDSNGKIFDVMYYDYDVSRGFISNCGYTNFVTTEGALTTNNKHRVQHNFFSCPYTNTKTYYGVSVGYVGNVHRFDFLSSAYIHSLENVRYRYTFDNSMVDSTDEWVSMDTSIYGLATNNTCTIPHNEPVSKNSHSYFGYQALYILPNNVFCSSGVVSHNKITGNSLWNTFIHSDDENRSYNDITNNSIHEAHIVYTNNLYDSVISNSICCGLLPYNAKSLKGNVNVRLNNSKSVFSEIKESISNAVFDNCIRIYMDDVKSSVFRNCGWVFAMNVVDSNIIDVSLSVISAFYQKVKGYTNMSDITDCEYVQAIEFTKTDLRDCTKVYFGMLNGMLHVNYLEMDNGENVLFNKINGNVGNYSAYIKNVKVMPAINSFVNGMEPILIPIDTMMDRDTSVSVVTRTWNDDGYGIVKIYNDGSMIP
jgi:hypothetical protein